MTTRLSGQSNLVQRIVSALILAAIVLSAVWMGGYAFKIVVVLICAAVLAEWLAMIHVSALGAYDKVIWACAAAFAAVSLVLGVGLISGLTLVVLAVVVLGLGWERNVRIAALAAGGFAFFGLVMVALFSLRSGPNGLVAIIFLFAVVWATDIAAYFAGRSFGGPKLAPSISPNKTWSGAAGGLLAAIVCGTAVAVQFQLMPTASAVVLAGLMSIVSQFGDLVESGFKRHFGVKDSGTLLPGHGGFMDRVDGLMPATVAFWMFSALIS